ncbi:hypothetical protein BpHYR1_039242 [Brachionus plicatilis]|uniref:Uncharacterized protein n=1 Tax=Brachionus plicatilis TaxID=10195 RepID=A0A3M7QUA4_BRAPC|nr:hypothetical protein BpHYR1_039242 [Brachionus plicatilis]
MIIAKKINLTKSERFVYDDKKFILTYAQETRHPFHFSYILRRLHMLLDLNACYSRKISNLLVLIDIINIRTK